MFIEIGKRLSQAPEERHMADAAPPELGELLCNVFYKHSAPLALQNEGNSPAASVLADFSFKKAKRRGLAALHTLRDFNHDHR